jgi:probable HAF family extracellular repeat protein
MNAKLFSISLLAAGVLLAAASQSNASGYKFTVLSAPGSGGYTEATAINNAGLVVGNTDGGFATIWNDTWATYIGTPDGHGWCCYGAYGINDSGQVVGGSITIWSDPTTSWNVSTSTALGLLDGTYWVRPTAINNSGQVVGYSYNSTGINATIWNGTTPTDLGTLGGGY